MSPAKPKFEICRKTLLCVQKTRLKIYSETRLVHQQPRTHVRHFHKTSSSWQSRDIQRCIKTHFFLGLRVVDTPSNLSANEDVYRYNVCTIQMFVYYIITRNCVSSRGGKCCVSLDLLSQSLLPMSPSSWHTTHKKYCDFTKSFSSIWQASVNNKGFLNPQSGIERWCIVATFEYTTILHIY